MRSRAQYVRPCYTLSASACTADLVCIVRIVPIKIIRLIPNPIVEAEWVPSLCRPSLEARAWCDQVRRVGTPFQRIERATCLVDGWSSPTPFFFATRVKILAKSTILMITIISLPSVCWAICRTTGGHCLNYVAISVDLREEILIRYVSEVHLRLLCNVTHCLCCRTFGRPRESGQEYSARRTQVSQADESSTQGVFKLCVCRVLTNDKVEHARVVWRLVLMGSGCGSCACEA
mmetsp:Transcript_40419/g.95044  ORF Transcript_40419/g.95044 Transcript_40419/m.95044 type:complete len:233 (+) Transcript_40419:4008-4706(+)